MTTTKRFRKALNRLEPHVRQEWAKIHPLDGGCKASMGGGKTCKRVACPYPSHWGGINEGGRLHAAVRDLAPDALKDEQDHDTPKVQEPKAPKAKKAPLDPKKRAEELRREAQKAEEKRKAKADPKPVPPPGGGELKAPPEVERAEVEAKPGADPAYGLAEALQRLVAEGASAKAVKALEQRVRALEGRTPVARKLEVKTPKGVQVVEGVIHEAMERVLYRCAARIHTLIVGPTGSGKTHLARQVAQALGLPFYTNSLTSGTSEGVLIGRLLPLPQTPDETVREFSALVEAFEANGQTRPQAEVMASRRIGASHFAYVTSDFVKAYESGGVYLGDECDSADANVLLILNQGLANSHLPIPHRPGQTHAKRNADFVCMISMNTWGHGADRQYVGRGALDAAFLDRFRMGQIMVDYDASIEEALVPADVLAWGRRVRDVIRSKSLRRVLSTRNMIDAARLIEVGCPKADWRGAYFADWKADDLAQVPQSVKP